MLITHEREKLINAILFFAENTRGLGKIKLFKLLYLLDFEHFTQTGLPVTGMEYRAWKMGPVPAELVQVWDDLDPDLADAFEICPERVIDYVRENVIAKRPFNEDYFTPREMRIMAALSERYRDELSEKMIDVTHAENGAWTRVWRGGAGNDQVISYDLAITADNPRRDSIVEMATDYRAMRNAGNFIDSINMPRR